MARSMLVTVTTILYFTAACEGGVHRITYNEDDLVGRCSSTCARLPDRTDKFGCDRISNCTLMRKGWTKGFVRCDWCTCDCRTSGNLPQKVVIEESKKVLTEDELWGTCKGTCSAGGLQKTNAFGCSEVRDCTLQKKGWISWFDCCDYCECDCIIKGYPESYRLENVKFNVGLAATDEADSVVVGKATVENHSSREQTFTKTISTSIERSRLWEETPSKTLSAEVTVSIEAPVLDISRLEKTTKETETNDYTWGETKTWTISEATAQQVVVGPNSAMDVTMVGTHYQAFVPYTAVLVTIYDNEKETRKSISGVLHEATVSNVHLVYGKSTPLPQK